MREAVGLSFSLAFVTNSKFENQLVGLPLLNAYLVRCDDLLPASPAVITFVLQSF